MTAWQELVSCFPKRSSHALPDTGHSLGRQPHRIHLTVCSAPTRVPRLWLLSSLCAAQKRPIEFKSLEDSTSSLREPPILPHHSSPTVKKHRQPSWRPPSKSEQMQRRMSQPEPPLLPDHWCTPCPLRTALAARQAARSSPPTLMPLSLLFSLQFSNVPGSHARQRSKTAAAAAAQRLGCWPWLQQPRWASGGGGGARPAMAAPTARLAQAGAALSSSQQGRRRLASWG